MSKISCVVPATMRLFRATATDDAQPWPDGGGRGGGLRDRLLLPLLSRLRLRLALRRRGGGERRRGGLRRRGLRPRGGLRRGGGPRGGLRRW